MKAANWYFHACPVPFPTTRWRCRVVDTADGDTATLWLDLGWFRLEMMEVRLSDIDTYERHSGTVLQRELGRQAWAFFLAHAGGRWAMLTTRMDTEKYGRILGTVDYLADDGTLHRISTELRAAGYEKQP
jgi:endonuclease YncB( thermonuclease family)